MKKYILVIKSLYIFIVCIGISLFFTGCNGCCNKNNNSNDKDESLSKIQKRGKLIVGVYADDTPPFGYVDANGRHCGFDIVFAHRLALDLFGNENKIEFIAVKPEERKPYLLSDKVDIVIATYTKTTTREEVLDFGLPYMKTTLGIVVQDSSNISSLQELINTNKTIIVNKGTFAERHLQRHYQNAKTLSLYSKDELFPALMEGRGSAIIHDEIWLLSLCYRNQNIKMLERIGEEKVIAPAVKKGNKALLDWLNMRITELRKEHFFKEIFEKELRPYFNSDVKPYDIIIEN